jgi:hypothetical protein
LAPHAVFIAPPLFKGVPTLWAAGPAFNHRDLSEAQASSLHE